MSASRSEIIRWLNQQLEAKGHGAKGQLARHLKVRNDAITRMLNEGDGERRDISGRELLAMGDFFNSLPPGIKPPAAGAPELTYEPDEIQQKWVPHPDQDGAGYDRESYEPTVPGAIPELDAKAGAGEGAVGEVMVLPMGGGTISAHKISAEWLIPIDYLREAVRDPSRAIVLPISGDSMMPNYAPGDRVVIDLSEHELRADGVYLISDGFNAPQIKRLQIIPFSVPRKCRIISDNPAYQAQEVETDMVHIMGRVSAYVGRR